MNRREFLGRAAGSIAAASALVANPAKAQSVAPSDTINLGIIGPGARGQEVMRNFLRVPGVRFSALCDVYEPRFDQSRKVTGEDTPTYLDYRQLLDAKDVDAVVIATPLSFHEEHVIAALASGRPVYSEKDMALTLDGCDHVYAAVKRYGKPYQFGTQYHFAPWFRKSLQAIRDGKIGPVTQIYSCWHRNNSWRRPVPDPKFERLINWRMYREYSGGLLAELGTHLIQWANEIYGAMPVSCVGSGGIDYWLDGREVPDNLQVIYRYPGGQSLFFSALTTNRYDGMRACIYGTGGTFVLTEDSGTQYWEPMTPNSAVPDQLAMQNGVLTGASFRSELPYTGQGETFENPQGLEGSPDFIACRTFIDSLRNNKKPELDENIGWQAGICVALGNQAIDKKTHIEFGDRAHLPVA
jgi:predicted dehydrogenase